MFYDPKLREALVGAIDRLTAGVVGQLHQVRILLEYHNGFQRRQAVAQESIAETLKALLKVFKGVPNPGAISAKVTSEENGSMKFRVLIPAFPDPIGDVVKGELTVVADGNTQVIDVAIGQTEVADLTAAEGTVAEMSYVLVDDAGNKSPVPAVFNLPVEDTIAPPSPGPLNAEVTGE